MKKRIKEDLLQQLTPKEARTLKQSIMEDVEFVNVVIEEKKKPVVSWRIGIAMACFVLCLGFFLPMFSFSPMATIAIDVNPGIELQINKKEKVSEVILHNAAAETIVGDMDLKNVDVEVAVHAIIGKMFQQGYLTDTKNSMLLTIQSDDEAYRLQLKETLLLDIESTYEAYQTSVAILSLELDYTSTYQDLAKQYNISEGKVALIQQAMQVNPKHQFEDFVNMSIHDINTFIQYQDISLENITSQGETNYSGYLTLEEVIQIIEKHAQVKISSYEYELDCDDNRLVYEIEFISGMMQYEYEINAISGEIIEVEVEK